MWTLLLWVRNIALSAFALGALLTIAQLLTAKG